MVGEVSDRECCRRVAGEEEVCDVGEAGGSGHRRGRRRLCPRETHGRPWPCEWVARRHCVKRRGERQMSLRPGMNAVASDGMERSGRFRRAAACDWRWWQRLSKQPALAMVAMGDCGDAILCTHGSCSKSFWDLPPRRRPWKACLSQNDDFLPRFGINRP